MTTIPPQRMDMSLTVIKDAIMAAQRDFQADIGLFPQDAPHTAGAVLNEIGGEVARLIAEFTRDAERPIAKASNPTPQNTGLKGGNIKSIQEAHSQTSDSEYDNVKAESASKGKRLTREDVRKANAKAQPKPPKQSRTRQLEQENAQLKSRVSTLEDTLRAHQIPLPL